MTEFSQQNPMQEIVFLVKQFSDETLQKMALSLLKQMGYPHSDFPSSMNSSREGLIDFIVGFMGMAVSNPFLMIENLKRTASDE